MKITILAIPFLLSILSCLAIGDQKTPATQSALDRATGTASSRAAKLKQHLQDFQLNLTYDGNEDDGPESLLLTIKEPPKAAAARLEQAVIDADQAKAIIDFLATDGFLDAAMSNKNGIPPGKKPRYTLTIGRLSEDLDLNMRTLRRLDGLRKVLSGDAAKSMDRILDKLSDQRKQWTQKPLSEDAAKRVEGIKHQLPDNFHLQIFFTGMRGNDLGSLNLGVGAAPAKSDAPAPYVQIKPEQATQIIDALVDDGFFENVWEWGRQSAPPGGMNNYIVETNQWGGYYLTYGPRVAGKLVYLRQFLDGDAGAAMDALLAKFDEAQKAKWHADADE